MSIKPRILLASAASLLLLIACSSNDPPKAGSTKDGVAATVNGTPISERLVGMMLKQRTELGRAASAESRNQFIDSLAMQVIITQEAVKKGLDRCLKYRIGSIWQASILVDAFVQDFLKNNAVMTTC